jgi:predicted HAD superfamily Cof-like phosphohydrolase
MLKEIEKVQAFHTKFNAQINDKPTMITVEEGLLRYELMKEELEEYKEAILAQDLVGVLDALTDMAYINCGSYVAHGLQKIAEAAFQEVQDSNMSKLGKNGKPVINGENGFLDERKPLGKILKGENYFEPNLEKFIK